MQFHVPQNIDLEDKIVGPLTMRQFIYLLIGGAIDYILFKRLLGGTQTNLLLFIVLVAPITLLSIALAFLKIQGQSFPEFVVALIVYVYRPRQRIWKREETSDTPLIQEDNKQPAKIAKEKTKRGLSADELKNISSTLDTKEQAAINDRTGKEIS